MLRLRSVTQEQTCAVPGIGNSFAGSPALASVMIDALWPLVVSINRVIDIDLLARRRRIPSLTWHLLLVDNDKRSRTLFSLLYSTLYSLLYYLYSGQVFFFFTNN